MRDLPPLKAMRVFEACVRLGSFTKAARELNVGQPAVSHQILALESDIGVPLFDRVGAQIHPTADAVAYFSVVSAALEQIDRSTRALRQKARPGMLSVATYPGIAMFWLMPKLAKLKNIAPSLDVRVVTSEQDRDMDLDASSCAILFGEGGWPGRESRLLIPEEVVPVAAPAIAMRLKKLPPASWIKQGPLIHLDEKDARWFTWRDWCEQRAPNAVHINHDIEVTNHGIAIHQALMGQGVALGWKGLIDDLLDNSLLEALVPEPITSSRGYYIVATAAFFTSNPGKSLLAALS